jgi:hypothetical protein
MNSIYILTYNGVDCTATIVVTADCLSYAQRLAAEEIRKTLKGKILDSIIEEKILTLDLKTIACCSTGVKYHDIGEM